MARLAVVSFALLVLAGCAAPTADEANAADAGITVDPDRPDTNYAVVKTGPSVGPDLDATTAAAPRLVEGEWWRIEFSSDFYAATNEVVRVVANATPEGYIFGMPHEGWFKEAIAYHAPAFGDVGLDLSYATHNVVFEPVRFPLEVGKTWETAFAASPMVATVESADDYTAVIRFDAPETPAQPTDPIMALLLGDQDVSMRMTYDARQHEIVEMSSFIGSWKVVEHGYDFQGWVTVPRGEHTAIDYGTFWALTPGDQPVTTRQIEVEGGFNRLTMMHVIIPLAEGVYSIQSTTPGGETFRTETLASKEFNVQFYEASDPDGTWIQEDSALGVAATYSMGIAYHQYDIHLPDQARRTDHSHAVIR